MTSPITLDDVRRAWTTRDPALSELICALAQLSEPRAERDANADSLASLQADLNGRLQRLPAAERRAHRTTRLAKLESGAGSEVAADRLGLHALIDDLWTDGGTYGRIQLLALIETVPLVWGPWRGLKRLFKQAEAAGDWEIYGALLARFDREYSGQRRGVVRRPTLRYLLRRGWRNLRRLGQTLPATYPDACVEVLRAYSEGTNFRRTWVANHIFFHESGSYNRTRFTATHYRSGAPSLKHRAFIDAWKRTPRPLFTLLERAHAETVRQFAVQSLKSDFRTALREVETSWVARLLGTDSPSVHDFATWILDNVPRFEQGAFRELGLHAAVLGLFDSPSDAAKLYAAKYARTHARDLPLARLLELANNSHNEVRRTAHDLLRDRHPRNDVGLDAWGKLLGTSYGHSLAVEALQEHFSARELTLPWFAERLLSGHRDVVDFATKLMTRLHPAKKVSLDFYAGLLDDPRLDPLAARVALAAVELRDPTALGADALRRLALHPQTSGRVWRWLTDRRVAPTVLGADFFKALAFEPTWESDAWMVALRTREDSWVQELTFGADRSTQALELLADGRLFNSTDLGFDWLFEMVQRAEPRYHAFAVETLSRWFHPADFADPEARGATAEAEASAEPAEIDLGNQTFLFTGKLATMTRGEAKKKVTTAKGKNASGVSAKLDYLVIGDEGSSLYGGGRKGSKQVKAEKLIEAGAGLKIISETAFLQMLEGKTVEVDEDAAADGAERLWKLATDPGPADAPLARFALHYLRHHHAEIHMAETDRPLDPGAELSEAFLTFERTAELLADKREPLRDLGLTWMHYELARWAPPTEALVALCELPDLRVRAFVELALTADELRKHRRYRLDPAALNAEAVYRFCESLHAETRALGMRLLHLHPDLAEPQELFRLSESPDRRLRAFVIRHLWSLYRDRGTSRPPRPPEPPAEEAKLIGFLRRTLFQLPPGPTSRPGKGPKVKPMPARKAKLALIEVTRDLAVEDADFAAAILPLYEEFLASHGASERAACLVALTRLGAVHPHLTVSVSPAQAPRRSA